MTIKIDLFTASSLAISGAGKTKRIEAFDNIRPLAVTEGNSRAASLANLNIALGKEPSEALVTFARKVYVIGRVQAVLNVDELKATEIVCYMAGWIDPEKIKSGEVTPRAIRKSQTGRRTEAQHKAVRAAEEWCSKLLAETGFGKAQTNAEANAKKRTPRPASNEAETDTPPAPSNVVKLEDFVGKGKVETGEEANRRVLVILNGLQGFCRNNGDLVALDLADLINDTIDKAQMIVGSVQLGKAVSQAKANAKK